MGPNALAAMLAALLTVPAPAGAAPEDPPRTGPPPSLVLLTLDTTRADYLGSYGARDAETPVLDALAARGTRYVRALAPSPLTLPAHASLLTGLAVPEHGVRDNGTAVLPRGLPTLATALAARGYSTGAFVASRVLDRRFGLDRGFDVYDDTMAAERLGQYGYPERDAAAVTSAALAWLATLPADRPYFLWAHFYDPHAPYAPPADLRRGSEQGDYAGEIAHVDREVGRLLRALPPGGRVVAVAGDHGEMLGEHGEGGHGIFLYRAALEVPLILAGPGVPAGRVVEQAVATRRLAPTLLALLLGDDGAGVDLGAPLPGIGSPATETDPPPIYSQTEMPRSAYGWATLEAVSDQRYRLIAAPRPELFDTLADPGEERNLITEERHEARRLKTQLDALKAGFVRRRAEAPPPDPQLEADLRSLGYLSTSGGAEAGTIDPKDGIRLLADFERARSLAAAGAHDEALPILEGLVERNPRNVPFLTRLAGARLETGRIDAALAAYRRAVELNPRLDFLHQHLADAYRRAGRLDDARTEYRLTLQLNPRAAGAWLALAELAHRAGQGAEERELLTRAVAAGTSSAAISSRLGQLELAAGDLDAAATHLEEATTLAPAWALPWLLYGQTEEARSRPGPALEHYRRAADAAPSSPTPHLHLGRLLSRQGDLDAARRHLTRAATLAPRSAEGQEARRLLESL